VRLPSRTPWAARPVRHRPTESSPHPFPSPVPAVGAAGGDAGADAGADAGVAGSGKNRSNENAPPRGVGVLVVVDTDDGRGGAAAKGADGALSGERNARAKSCSIPCPDISADGIGANASARALADASSCAPDGTLPNSALRFDSADSAACDACTEFMACGGVRRGTRRAASRAKSSRAVDSVAGESSAAAELHGVGCFGVGIAGVPDAGVWAAGTPVVGAATSVTRARNSSRREESTGS
jgi:hypothetical protein